MSNVPVTLKPLAGFCIKSSTLQSAVYSPPPDNSSIPVPIGLKIFINIAWDPHVPAPPETSEEAIHRAITMRGKCRFDDCVLGDEAGKAE